MLALQIAAGLLAATVLVLVLPVELRFQVRGVDPVQSQVDVRALYGLWQRRIAAAAPRYDQARPLARSPHATAVRSARRRADGLDRLQALWRDAGLRRSVLNRLRAALESLQWRELRLHVRLGLDDPADTGRLWVLLGPLGAALASLRAADIAIEPDFVEPTLSFEARGHVVLVPLRVLASLAILAAIFGLAVARQRRWRPQRLT